VRCRRHRQARARSGCDNGKVFITIYDSTLPEGTGEGVYIKAKAFELTDEEEVTKARGYLDRRVNKSPRDPSRYLGKYPRRVYKAVPEKVWINSEGEVDGNYIDTRTEIDLMK